MDLFDGFNFTNYKDFEISYTRQKVAASMFCDYLALGYDRDIVYQYLLRYVSCLLGNEDLHSLIVKRDRYLRDFGTPFPAVDPLDCVDLFTKDIFDIGFHSGRQMDVPVYDESFPRCLFDYGDDA